MAPVTLDKSRPCPAPMTTQPFERIRHKEAAKKRGVFDKKSSTAGKGRRKPAPFHWLGVRLVDDSLDGHQPHRRTGP